MQLLVVGAGEMGRWFARTAGADAVAFADRERSIAEAAASELGDVGGSGADSGAPGSARAVPLAGEERFDVVCVAVPMSAVPGAVAEHADRATEAVVDVSGEMRDSVAALRTHAGDREHASFHPLFSAANAPGNVPVVDDGGRVVADIRASIAAAGNQVFETTPAEHDTAMETVQARAHAAVMAYALAAEDVDPRFHTELSGPLSDLVDQLTGNDPDVYAEIQARFQGAETVAERARVVADADPGTFRELYEDAGR